MESPNVSETHTSWPPEEIVERIDAFLMAQRDEPARRVHDAHRLRTLIRDCLLQLPQNRSNRFVACASTRDEAGYRVYPHARYGFLLQLPFTFGVAISADFWHLPAYEQRRAAIVETAAWLREQYAARVRLGDAGHGKPRVPDDPSTFDDAPVDAFDLSTLDVRFEECTRDGSLIYTLETAFRSRVIVLAAYADDDSDEEV